MKIEKTISEIIYYMALVMLMTLSISAQVAQDWKASFNQSNNDSYYPVSAAFGDGVIVAGAVIDNGNDIVLISYNSDGNEVWRKTLQLPGNQMPFAIAQGFQAGNNGTLRRILVTGESDEIFTTWMFDISGNLIWQEQHVHADLKGRGTNITIDFGGYFYVVGIVYSDQRNTDYAIIKYDYDGQQAWLREQGSAASYEIPSSIVYMSPNLYVTGYSNTNGTYDYYTISIDRDGSFNWGKMYNGTGGGDDRAFDMAVNYGAVIGLPNLIYITGESLGTGGITDYTTICYDEDGVEQWVSRYFDPNEGRGDSRAIAIEVNRSDGVYVTGRSTADIATVKYDENSGDEIWSQRYNGPGDGNDLALDVRILRGNVYVSGYIIGANFNNDYAMIKYTEDGVQFSVDTYNGSANSTDRAYSVASYTKTFNSQTSSSQRLGFILTGFSSEGNSTKDITSVAFSETGIDWCNVQWPPNGEINQGEEFTVYAQAWRAEDNGSIISRIGVSRFNINPSLWNESSWQIATYNTEVGNNSEYMLDIGSTLEPGTYYYASQFISINEERFSYGGYSEDGGGFWDGAINKSGVLVVKSASSDEPTVAAPTPTQPSENVISLFSNTYTDVTVDTWSAGWDQADVSDFQVSGDDIKQYTNLVYAGIEFTSSTIDISSMGYFHMDIWTPDATALPTTFKIKLVDFGANGVWDGGGDDVEYELSYDASTSPALATGEWVSFDIPISDFTGLTTKEHLAQIVISGELNTVYLDNVYFYSNTTSTESEENLPSNYSLKQNYPNPFNPTTNIEFSIPEQSFVSLKIYDVLGKEVSQLVNQELQPGFHSVEFDASEISTGVYFYKLESGNFIELKKMSLIK